MARITDLPFRLLCRKLGAALAYTEMVNCNAVSRGNKAAMKLFQTNEEDYPLGIQLFGSRPDRILDAALKVKQADGIFIDLNFSCPDASVINQGAGAALLKRPARMREIITNLVDNQSLPVTAKIRLGSKDINKCIKIATVLEKAGVSALAVHARTITQKNSGKPDWNAIRAIKSNVSIPVIGNGGIHSVEGYNDIISATNCDAVMIGKEAIYNPAIFREIEIGKRDVKSFHQQLELLEIYCSNAYAAGIVRNKRVLQRAIDFLKQHVSPARLKALFDEAETLDAFILLIKKELS